jgi:predicted  nucleic acid-binding Zn-ribbon protein
MSLEELENQQRLVENEISRIEQELRDYTLDEEDYEAKYQEFIDDSTGDIEILGMSYSAATVLEEVDPTAYAIELSNYVDSLNIEDDEGYQDLQQELSDLEDEHASLEDQIMDAEEDDE